MERPVGKVFPIHVREDFPGEGGAYTGREVTRVKSYFKEPDEWMEMMDYGEGDCHGWLWEFFQN